MLFILVLLKFIIEAELFLSFDSQGERGARGEAGKPGSPGLAVSETFKLNDKFNSFISLPVCPFITSCSMFKIG